MATAENLKEAFAGESQANRKYLAFAKAAEAEGFAQVARLFRAVSEAETIHALTHLRVMGGVKSTAENLQAAVEGEGFEFQQMYPKFLAQARAEGNEPAVMTFRNALDVERIHHGLYSKSLSTVKTGKDLPATSIYVCSICGNTVTGGPQDTCSVCGAPKERFFEVR